MMSVGQAFEEFLQSLELTELQREEVIRQHTSLREHLRSRLAQYKTDFLSGSYSRNTAIRPLHDIDIFVVLGDTAGSEPASHTITALQRVQQALKEAYPNKDLPIIQQHSVNIEFSGSGIAFDVVPAFEAAQQEVYFIPERDSGRWIRTNPRHHQDLSTQANERANKKLKPLLKAVKHWKSRLQNRPLTSFHLEALSYGAFRTPPSTYLEGLVQLFEHLSSTVMSPCLDPAGLGPVIDAYMDRSARRDAQKMLDEAAQLARRALGAATTRQREAHAHLRELFGAEYPERGGL